MKIFIVETISIVEGNISTNIILCETKEKALEIVKGFLGNEEQIAEEGEINRIFETYHNTDGQMCGFSFHEAGSADRFKNGYGEVKIFEEIFG